MGREIRRVPANWKHPMQKCHHSPWAGGCDEAKRNDGMCYMPMMDTDFDTALQEWLAEYEAWKKDPGDEPFEETPPFPEYYRPKFESAEWYQVYETVSEGTPVTPPFATKAEIVDYLVEHGDFWDQHRGNGGWTRENAEGFVA